MFVIRKIVRRGSSLAVSIPVSMNPPREPYVYLTRRFVAYSEVFPLGDEFVGFLKQLSRVKRRRVVSKGSVTYLYTVPSEAATTLNLREGITVLVLRYVRHREPVIVVYPEPPLDELMTPLIFR